MQGQDAEIKVERLGGEGQALLIAHDRPAAGEHLGGRIERDQPPDACARQHRWPATDRGGEGLAAFAQPVRQFIGRSTCKKVEISEPPCRARPPPPRQIAIENVRDSGHVAPWHGRLFAVIIEPVSSAINSSLRTVSRGLAGVARRALDFVLPPLCLRCRELVSDPHSLCAVCWSELKFLAEPLCACCGLPFPHALGEGVKCAACLAKPPAFDRARAAIAYDDTSRDLILPLKHADRLEAAPVFGRWMANAAADLIAECEILIPVPLHWRRLVKRRYNQAAVLAHAIAKKSRHPVDIASLTRPNASLSQGEMPSARARLKNVARAFVVPEERSERIAGRRILLVDDVLTTGATLGACAKALKRAGAVSVSAVTLARVVRPLSRSL